MSLEIVHPRLIGISSRFGDLTIAFSFVSTSTKRLDVGGDAAFMANPQQGLCQFEDRRSSRSFTMETANAANVSAGSGLQRNAALSRA